MSTDELIEVTRADGTVYYAKRLPCGCVGECNPYAHDTAWDWDGTLDREPRNRCDECGQFITDDMEICYDCYQANLETEQRVDETIYDRSQPL